MSIRNKLLVPQQGHVTGKGRFSDKAYRQRKQIAMLNGGNVYPGTSDDANLKVCEGEVLVGDVNLNGRMSQSSAMLVDGHTSLAGLSADMSPEVFMRSKFLLGVVTSEMDGNPISISDPSKQDFGFTFTGSITVKNPKLEPFFPGDIIAVTAPPKPGQKRWDGGKNSMVLAGRNAPASKQLYMLEKYNPADLSSQIDGAYMLMTKDSASKGVSDLDLKNLLNNTEKLTPLQEEALGWKFGLIGMYIAMRDALGNNRAEDMLNNQELLQAVMRAVFQDNIIGNNGGRAVSPDDLIAYIKRYPVRLLLGSLSSAMHAKASRILGTAMYHSTTEQTTDVNVGYGVPRI